MQARNFVPQVQPSSAALKCNSNINVLTSSCSYQQGRLCGLQNMQVEGFVVNVIDPL